MSKYPENWEIVPLENVAEIIGGGTPSRSNADFWGDDYFWITPSEVVELDGRFVYRSKEKISVLGLKNSSAKLLPPGTILMTSRASIGYAAIAKTSVCTNQGFQSIICGESLDHLFALHQIRYRKSELELLAAGSTFAEISSKNVRSFLVIVPPLPEQKKISEILSFIDNLIAVLVKKEEKNKYLALGVLENIFSNNLKIKKLNEMSILITKGTTPTSLGRTFTKKGINFIKGESIIEDGEIDPKKISFIDHDTHLILSRSKILSGDILFTIAGTLGKLALAKEEILPANTNQAIAIIRVKKETLRPQFLYHWLKARIIKNIIDKNQTIGAQPNVSLSQIGEFPVPLISLENQDQICQQLDSIDKVTSAIRKKIIHLKSLRKSLTSDLLSGRKRVTL